jgi:hypothetical protein
MVSISVHKVDVDLLWNEYFVYPECPYFCKANVIDGMCGHPNKPLLTYCSLICHINKCPFDIKEELKNDLPFI